jgi:catechol 2,3-dioxygenase-like lactoylglutathione lyase family enzyme
MLSDHARDRLRVMLVVPPGRWEATCAFYAQALGFEREYVRGEGERWLAGFCDGPTRLVLATPGVVPSVPPEATVGAVLLLETADPAGVRAALIARGVAEVGALESQDGACFFELRDPAENRVWMIRYPAQGPDSAASSAASTGDSSSSP